MQSFVALVAVVALFAGVARAHHSFTAIYDSTRTVRLEGTVSEFAFIHPHPFIFMTVQSGSVTKTWRLEMDNRFELQEIGMTAHTFRRGDRIAVAGSPGRTEPEILYLRLLIRAVDGLRYEQVGSTPSLSSEAR